MHNKAWKLLDKNYAIDFLKEKVLPQFPDFTDVEEVEIATPKKNIWESTYHIVVEYKTRFIKKDGGTEKVPIYCSAHSEEPRKNVYKALKYLWDQGFSDSYLTIPKPLFYSDYFNGTFYRGVEGKNLYYYIKENDRDSMEKIVKSAANWFAKLHSLPTDSAQNFNKENSRIETVIPGKEYILYRIKKEYPEYSEFFNQAYDYFIMSEREFLGATGRRWLIHGDAHPENIIKMSEKKIAVIDFTDICLSDFARDLGCFLQQVDYMLERKVNDKEFARKVQNLFIREYLKDKDFSLDENLQKRINNYYYWTALRTATFFLIKSGPTPERAKPLIEDIKKNIL